MEPRVFVSVCTPTGVVGGVTSKRDFTVMLVNQRQHELMQT